MTKRCSSVFGGQQYDHFGDAGREVTWASCTRKMQCSVGSALGPVEATKPLMELAGRRTFRMHTDCCPAVRRSNAPILTAVPLCSSVCKNMQMCFAEILNVPLDE